jgi:membrane protein DedA with SNARE-associated domain
MGTGSSNWPVAVGAMNTHPPTFLITDQCGCIGRFWWVNTIPYPGGEWFRELFPFWGTSHWYRS